MCHDLLGEGIQLLLALAVAVKHDRCAVHDPQLWNQSAIGKNTMGIEDGNGHDRSPRHGGDERDACFRLLEFSSLAACPLGEESKNASFL